METLQEFLKQVEWLKADQKFSEAIKRLEEMITKISDNHRLYEELGIFTFLLVNLKSWKGCWFCFIYKSWFSNMKLFKRFYSLNKRKISEAIVYLEKSNKLLPNNAEVLRNLWWAYNLDKQVKKEFIFWKEL